MILLCIRIHVFWDAIYWNVVVGIIDSKSPTVSIFTSFTLMMDAAQNQVSPNQ